MLLLRCRAKFAGTVKLYHAHEPGADKCSHVVHVYAADSAVHARRPPVRKARGPMQALTSVARGSLYEALAAVALQPFGIAFRVRGGAGDKGVDLQGSWPQTALSHLQLIAQCKSNESAVGSAALRELVAAVAHRQQAVGDEHTMFTTGVPVCSAPTARAAVCGVFFAQAGFTREATHAAFQARSPLLLAHMSMNVLSNIAVKTNPHGWHGADRLHHPLSGGVGPPSSDHPLPQEPRSASVSAVLHSVSPNRAFLATVPRVAFSAVRPSVPSQLTPFADTAATAPLDGRFADRREYTCAIPLDGRLIHARLQNLVSCVWR
jgi:hypothetical protein